MKTMKTKVRTTTHPPKNGYIMKYIQILDKRYPDMPTSDTLEPIGTISFQYTVGNAEGYDWYAMRFIVETDNPDNLFKMAKLARYITTNCSSRVQPDELMQVIGAEEHFVYLGDWIPETYRGMKYYKVMVNNSHYSTIIAPNDIIAQKKLNKKRIDDGKLVFDHIIQ